MPSAIACSKSSSVTLQQEARLMSTVTGECSCHMPCFLSDSQCISSLILAIDTSLGAFTFQLVTAIASKQRSFSTNRIVLLHVTHPQSTRRPPLLPVALYFFISRINMH